jgi:hypothetical protein
MLASPDSEVDAAARNFVPWFIKPFLSPFFARHHAERTQGRSHTA